MEALIPIWLCLLILVLIPRKQRFLYSVIRRRREKRLEKTLKGEGKPIMPIEFLNECLGKVCAVMQHGDVSGYTGKITAVKDNWIRIEQKNTVRFLNADMIKEIQILPEKYQK